LNRRKEREQEIKSKTTLNIQTIENLNEHSLLKYNEEKEKAKSAGCSLEFFNCIFTRDGHAVAGRMPIRKMRRYLIAIIPMKDQCK